MMSWKFYLRKKVGNIATLKCRIKRALDQTKYDNFYGTSTKNSFPYIRYFLGNNFTGRLSNKKAIRNIWYQVDVFSEIPIDVEDLSSILSEVELVLDAEGLFVTDWLEDADTSNSTQYPIYHYFVEVRS